MKQEIIKIILLATIALSLVLFYQACDKEDSPTSSSTSGSASSSGDCPNGRSGANCKDGTKSTATGSGACSSHGGVSSWICK